MAVIKNAIGEMEKRMNADSVQHARIKADSNILAIKLAELREQQGIKQTEMKGFSQASVSKIEKRKDMKLSTLIEYLDDIGLGLEIRVYSKSDSKNDSTTLLRI